MKQLSLIIAIGCASLRLLAQGPDIVFHSSGADNYSKTDFSKIDSLNCWFYVLTDKSPGYEDAVKPVGQLIFQRTHAAKDKIREELFNGGFVPNVIFQIFDIKDSAYCFKKSRTIRTVSSCNSPDVGGDIVILGKYIFFANSVCLQCKGFDNSLDYCRPVINKIFLSVDRKKAASLEQMVKQFPIKGQVMKLPF